MSTEESFIGKRCRLRSLAYDNKTGAPMWGLTGTIRQQIENLGRTLLLIEWDMRGESTFVFPKDLDLLEGNHLCAKQDKP